MGGARVFAVWGYSVGAEPRAWGQQQGITSLAPSYLGMVGESWGQLPSAPPPASAAHAIRCSRSI